MKTYFLLFAAMVSACGDDNRHTYSAPPPGPPRPVDVRVKMPDLPPGTLGADARIVSVSDSATGTPVSLHHVRGPIVFTVLAARGPGTWLPDGRERLELIVRGRSDTTITLLLEHPAPAVIAHNFILPAQTPGHYSAQFRLIMRGTVSLAESIPLHYDVQR